VNSWSLRKKHQISDERWNTDEFNTKSGIISGEKIYGESKQQIYKNGSWYNSSVNRQSKTEWITIFHLFTIQHFPEKKKGSIYSPYPCWVFCRVPIDYRPKTDETVNCRNANSKAKKNCNHSGTRISLDPPLSRPTCRSPEPNRGHHSPPVVYKGLISQDPSDLKVTKRDCISAVFCWLDSGLHINLGHLKSNFSIEKVIIRA